jgi:hypothetical protein
MIRVIFILLLAFFSMRLNAQCEAKAGGRIHRCSPETPLVLGTSQTANGGIPPYTYSWTIEPIYFAPPIIPYLFASDILSDTSSANPSLTYLNIGDSLAFFLTIKDAVGCQSTDTFIVTTSYFSQDAQSMYYWINQGDSIYLDTPPNVSGGYGSTNNGLSSNFYEWNPSSGLSDNHLAYGFWARPDSTTFYSATVTDIKGCTMTGGIFYYIYVGTAGLDKLESNDLELFPNPTSNKIQIQKTTSNSIEYYELFNAMGQLIERLDGDVEMLDLTNYDKGIYHLKYFGDDKMTFKKIIKD